MEHKQPFAVHFIQSQKETRGGSSGSHIAGGNAVGGDSWAPDGSAVLLWSSMGAQINSCPLKTDMYKQCAGHLLTIEIPQIIVRKAPLGQMTDSEVIYGPFYCALQVPFPVTVLIKQWKIESTLKESNEFQHLIGKTLWCVFIIVRTGIRKQMSITSSRYTIPFKNNPVIFSY